MSKADYLASAAAWSLELLERKIAALSVPCFLYEERRRRLSRGGAPRAETVAANTVVITWDGGE